MSVLKTSFLCLPQKFPSLLKVLLTWNKFQKFDRLEKFVIFTLYKTILCLNCLE